MSLHPQHHEQVKLFHPLSSHLDGTFEVEPTDKQLTSLEERFQGGVYDFQAKIKPSLGWAISSMVVGSQYHELSQLHDFDLATTAGGVHLCPTEATKANYVKKVVTPEMVGSSILWLSEQALQGYDRHQSSPFPGLKPRRHSFAASGIMNYGKLSGTEMIDSIVDGLPDLLKAAGGKVVKARSYDRNDAATDIRHRIWPIHVESDDPEDNPGAFYSGEREADFLSLRRRRPRWDVVVRFGRQRMLMEAYKESFVEAIPAELTGEIADLYRAQIRTEIPALMLGKESKVAAVLGKAFADVIDMKDETTRAIVPYHTRLMLRFTDPFRDADSLRRYL
jgi:hypothetical protein